MSYFQQLIYLLVGMHDEVAVLTLKDSSPVCEKFDEEVTVVFQYTQREREQTHKELLEGLFTHGIIRAKGLNYGNEILIPDKDDNEFHTKESVCLKTSHLSLSWCKSSV